MSDPSAALQIGMTGALRDWRPLAAAMKLEKPRVYDVAPANAPYPHIILGEDQILDDSAEGIEGEDAFVDVHIWTRSKSPGLVEGKQIAAEVKACLLEGFVVAGFDLKQVQFVSTRHLMDPDEKSGHSIVTVRLMLEPLDP